MFLSPVFLTALDSDRDGVLTLAEMTDGFRRWFNAWNSDASGTLTDDQLRAGIDKVFSPFRQGAPFRFGPPPGNFGPPPNQFMPPDNSLNKE